MTISARVIADSIPFYGSKNRITTMVLKYPRFIHAELMTHRVFSRNASSSRAIPVKKMIRSVLDEPAMPVWWGRNQAGMQARQELVGWRLRAAKAIWLAARYPAVFMVWLMTKLDVHKQLSNRFLEPWLHIEVVVTSTYWANFYALRDHADAQPEMRALAVAMYNAHMASTPTVLERGEWHLPFISADDKRGVKIHLIVQRVLKGPHAELSEIETLRRMSAARCARVSYLTHEGRVPGIEEDLKLFDRLAGGNPKHASPLEHQAAIGTDSPETMEAHYRSNFAYPWVQFRKLVPNENTSEFKDFIQ